jgi:4-cresol dehydrogenase (hydroxylating) flavoprotein subunit
MDPTALHNAIGQWTAALGPDAVRHDAAALERYARTTAPQGHAPGAVLYPASTEHVQRVVQIAAKHRVPIHPISRGRNWGYGDATPPTSGAVVVDLQRMNRVIEVNEQLAYAVVEPGVSQGQLFEYLRDRHPNLWMDSTGAGVNASLVGNTLDRGFGHTPVGDHFLHSAGFEVVLGDGRVLRTGYGHYANAKATYAYRYGVGPMLDGLFAQSNYGVVTRVGVWLMPRPEAFGAFFASARDDAQLADLMDRLAPLRLSGMLRSAVHVANDVRVLSSRIAYPFEKTGGATLMPDEVRRELSRTMELGAWNVSGGLYGTRGSVAAARRAINRALAGYRVIYLDDAQFAFAKRAIGFANKLGLMKSKAELLQVVAPAYDLLKGKPNDEFLRGVLWHVPPRKLEETKSLDPLDHNVGLIWCSPVVPSTGEHARAIVDLMRPIYHRHGFDFPITMTLITERALCCVTNISFDRANPEQTQRATACYEALFDALMKAGYPPYRTGPGGFAKLRQADDTFWDVCGAIKAALDPGGVISPGRYVG